MKRLVDAFLLLTAAALLPLAVLDLLDQLRGRRA
jgi:hypothetical protein